MTVTTDWTDAVTKYSASDFAQWWDGGAGSIGGLVASDVGGEFAISNPSGIAKINLTANIARLLISRFRISSTPGSTVTLFRFRSGSNTLGSLCLDSSNRLLLRDSGGNQVGGGTAVSAALNNGTYYVIEVGWLVNATAGRVEVRIDGTQISALTSLALGGGISNSIGTGDGVHTTIDAIECAGGTNMVVDFTITRTADAVWVPASDWFASAGSTPALKKKTMRFQAGSAGNGAYGPANPPTGADWSIGASPSGSSFSDAIRSLPFVDDSGYLTLSSITDSNHARITFRLETSPPDVGAIRTGSHVYATRYTVAQGDHYYVMLMGNTLYDDSVYTQSTAAYSGHTVCHDTNPNTGTAWTKSAIDSGNGGTQLELGLRGAAVS